MTKNDNNKMEKIMVASPETLSLIITEEECYLVLKALDLYSRIWIGQYDRIDDLSIYDTGDKWNQNSVSHMLFQQIRDLLIPYLTGRGDYKCCSLGIWSDKTDIRAINAYDIQQRLRYEVSWYKNPEGDITVNYDKPWIRGDLGDFSVFCHRNDDDVIVTLYLSEEQLKTIQTALKVLRLLIRREIKSAFMFFSSNEEALSVAEELTKVYKEFEFRSFSSDKDYGRKIYGDLISKTAMLMERINKTSEEKAYVEYIRVNVPPANPFIPFEEAVEILDQPFEHFKKTRRKIPPNDVLNYPGAGFLTKVIGRERSTTDYLLVWYEGKTRTEYYYVGEDFLFKHGGQIDIPRDIKEYIRLKCKKRKNHGKRD